MDRHAKHIETDIQQHTAALELLQQWGFPYNDQTFYQMARAAAEYQHLKTGQIIVKLGLADEATVETHMAARPKDRRTLEWLAEHIPAIRGQMQKLLALSEGNPWFDTIPQPHAAFTDPAVFTACTTHTAVLTTTDTGMPCLVFAEYDNLIQYRQQGRDACANDPIRRHFVTAQIGKHHLHELPILAIGNRLAIQQLLGNSDLAAQNANTRETRVFTHSQARTTAEKTLTHLLDHAIAAGASDINWQPQRDGRAIVRLHRDGIWHPHPTSHLSAESANELNRLLHSLTNATGLADKRPVTGKLLSPADGSMIYRNSSDEVFLRASYTAPDLAGSAFDGLSVESVCLRLRPRTETVVDLKTKGHSPRFIRVLDRIISEGQGIIAVVGPTGHGKSTTLAGAIGLSYSRFGTTRNRLSIEDPKETDIPGVCQHSVNQDNPFDDLIAAALRQHPNEMLIGEFRDRASTAAGVRLAVSGHLTYTTGHANDCTTGYRVMRSYINNPNVSNATAAVVTETELIEGIALIASQRLVPQLCPHCATAAAPLRSSTLDNDLKHAFERGGLPCDKNQLANLYTNARTINPDGCDHCQHYGTTGLIPAVEWIEFNDTIRAALHDQAAANRFDRNTLAKHRATTLFDEVLTHVLAGRTPLSALVQH